MKKIIARIFARFGLRDPRVRVLLCAVLVCIYVGVDDAGSPLEVPIRDVRNDIRKQPASGDIVLVGVDDRTLDELGRAAPDNKLIADLTKSLDKAGAERVYLDFILKRSKDTQADLALADALRAAPRKMFIATRFTDDQVKGRLEHETPDPLFAKAATVVNTNSRSNFLGQVWNIPYALRVGSQLAPTMAASIAKREGLEGQEFRVDYAINHRTVPTISGVDVLQGRTKASLVGKTVVLAPTAAKSRSVVRIPGYGPAPEIYPHIIAAETLKRGRPVDGGWLPAALAMFGLAYAFLYSKWKASVLAIGVGVIASTLLTDSLLLSLDVVPGLLMFLIVAVWQARASYGKRRATTNDGSGLPNLSALRAASQDVTSTLTVALVRNFATVRSTLSEAGEIALVRQISDRLALGTAGSTLYQGDDGTFAWFVQPGVEAELDDQLEALHAVFRSPVVVNGRQIDLDVTFGVDRNSERSITSRYGSASVAAVEAGQEGLKWKGYDSASLEGAEWKLSMLGRLDQAIDNGEVWVAFQPQIDLKTGLIDGAEALVRWSHPEKGEISPIEFVIAAEQHNRIERLTDHVLEQSIKAYAHLCRATGSFTVSVNLSATLLETRNLVAKVSGMLARHNMPADQLVLEITESAAIGENERSLQTLTQLRDLGVSISLDDYGTGFSTLEYLKRVPANEIKIDRSFVKQLLNGTSDRLVVNSTVQLAHALGCRVVAEGVETDEIYDALVEMGCDSAQGYLIGPPMRLERLLERLTASRDSAAA